MTKFSRRRLLEGMAVGVGGLASGTTGVGATRSSAGPTVGDDDFEEREWGYVKTGWEPPAGTDRPVVLTMDGYTAGSPSHYLELRDGTLLAVDINDDDHSWRAPENQLRDEYVTAHASIRGTGCSSGTFDLYERRHAWDGREVIEWLADRPWSLDRVGMYGGSYSGFTAFFVASARPPSLAAVSANMLTADLYRGVVFPGGVPNSVFPSYWALARRPASDYLSAYEGAVQDRDRICAENVATRTPPHPSHEEAVWYTHRTDDQLWRNRSLVTYAKLIEAPTYISNAWQDEQTGPRGGPALYRAIEPDPASPPATPGRKRPPVHEEPKLLRGTNGIHETAFGVADEDALRWFDYWLLGRDTGIMDEPSVKLHLNRGAGDSHTTVGFDSFLERDATWERFYLRSDRRLAREAPGSDGGSDDYVTGSARQSWFFEAPSAGNEVTLAEGPDVLTYRSPAFSEPHLVAGPITATLYASSTAAATDVFVRLADENEETGEITPLQRGLLRASHRELDEANTVYNSAGDIVRPYHPHTNPEPITPGETYRYDVEVYPLGHIVYPGHRLVVRIHDPPLVNGLSGYEPSREPGVTTVHHDDGRPSSLLLPLERWPANRELPPEPDCGDPAGYRCLQGYTDVGTGGGLD